VGRNEQVMAGLSRLLSGASEEIRRLSRDREVRLCYTDVN